MFDIEYFLSAAAGVFAGHYAFELLVFIKKRIKQPDNLKNIKSKKSGNKKS